MKKKDRQKKKKIFFFYMKACKSLCETKFFNKIVGKFGALNSWSPIRNDLCEFSLPSLKIFLPFFFCPPKSVCPHYPYLFSFLRYRIESVITPKHTLLRYQNAKFLLKWFFGATAPQNLKLFYFIKIFLFLYYYYYVLYFFWYQIKNIITYNEYCKYY